jgi:hypothetical protein
LSLLWRMQYWRTYNSTLGKFLDQAVQKATGSM